jgi:cobalt-zinc-cadmium efflux system outer membrane protein
MVNEKKVKSGSISTEDLLRTRLLCDQFEVELISERQEYDDDVNDLKLLLNISDSIKLIDETGDLTFTLSLDSTIFYALANRPDLLIEQQTIELNKKDRILQKARRAPYMELGVLYNPQNTITYAGTFATLAIPIFDRNQDEVQKNSVAIDQSSLSRQYKELQVRNEINKAYTTYNSNLRIMKKYETILTEYTQVFNSVRNSYIAGQTSLVDFLEAHKTFLETQEGFHDTKYNFRKSYLDLLYVSGMLNTNY